ncbi:hypothetical protein E2C01_075034 [Portunus trituberculatus]|uniref:Uncharacterized protein n=1 Tax=Portunus trituberculatus TaxID=210409 RepID=A0A5B7IIU3_PORTR|nr:hypothetical protein [Portunus trituberculatus]
MRQQRITPARFNTPGWRREYFWSSPRLQNSSIGTYPGGACTQAEGSLVPE